MVKAIGYLRVSTSAAQQQNGLDAQRADIERYALANDLEIASWHVDELSGATPADERQGFLSALAAIEEHSASIFIAQKRDRLARDVVIAATITKLVEEVGAKIVTADGASTSDTPEGIFLRQLLDVFSQYERAIIRARIKASFTAMKIAGKKWGHDKFRDTPEGKPIADRVAEMRKQGKSFTTIANTLNKDHIPTKLGKLWDKKKVKDMVQPRHRVKPISELGLHIGPLRRKRVIREPIKAEQD
jgi:DNA invertase Pin-like site-specific DNA recombinase